MSVVRKIEKLLEEVGYTIRNGRVGTIDDSGNFTPNAPTHHTSFGAPTSHTNEAPTSHTNGAPDPHGVSNGVHDMIERNKVGEHGVNIGGEVGNTIQHHLADQAANATNSVLKMWGAD